MWECYYQWTLSECTLHGTLKMYKYDLIMCTLVQNLD